VPEDDRHDHCRDGDQHALGAPGQHGHGDRGPRGHGRAPSILGDRVAIRIAFAMDHTRYSLSLPMDPSESIGPQRPARIMAERIYLTHCRERLRHMCHRGPASHQNQEKNPVIAREVPRNNHGTIDGMSDPASEPSADNAPTPGPPASLVATVEELE